MATRRILSRWGLGFGLGLIVLALVVAAGLSLLVDAGAYNVAADAPHSGPVARLLDTVRIRSVAVRAQNVVRPGDLADPKRVAAGAGLYKEMCSGCHLAPGMEPSEISQGLYPRAPALIKPTGLTPEQEFWVIKHGIKMSGMAAWGVTHSDDLIWNMVAFIDRLPSLSADDYRAATKDSGEEHEHMMHGPPSGSSESHDHGENDGNRHDYEHRH
jgi:mono/diheme cytochrome c family protein